MRTCLGGVVVIVALAAGGSLSGFTPQDPVAAAVDRYARGDYDAAIAALPTSLTVAEFLTGLERWTAAGEPAARERRGRVAATFGLDAVWTITRTIDRPYRENWDAWGRSTPSGADRVRLANPLASSYVPRWSVTQLGATGPVDAIDRTIWLAAVGIMENGSAWQVLRDDVLPLAQKRLPGDPRLRLAEILSRTNHDLGTLRLTTAFDRDDLLQDEDFPSSVTRRIPAAIRAFETLLDDPGLAGEVELRIAYLEIRRREWPLALQRLDRARARLAEPILLATTDFFTGFVHERLKKPDAAIDAYRRAHAIVPTMYNLTARLAALLYLRNEREDAYAILDRAFNARIAPQELLVSLERADARFVPAHLAELRAALR